MNIQRDASRTDTEPPLHRRTPGVQGNGRGGLYPRSAGSQDLGWACATSHPVGSLCGKPQQPPLQPYPMSGSVPGSCRNYPIQSSQSVPLVVPLSSHCEDGETEAQRGDATCTGVRACLDQSWSFPCCARTPGRGARARRVGTPGGVGARSRRPRKRGGRGVLTLTMSGF